MYPTPPSIKTEVFFRVPDHLRRPGQLNAERRAAAKGGDKTDCFLEGPSFDLNGNLYLVDVAYSRIFRVDPAGNIEVLCEYNGEPNGLKIHRDGRIFVTDHKLGLLLLDPNTGGLLPVVERYMTESFKGLNDLFLTSQGDIYFTDQGQSSIDDPNGKVYRLNVAGRLERILHNVPSPNGIVMSPDEKLLYVAATRGNAVWRSYLTPEGALVRTGIFVQLSGGTGPDGMAMDIEGNLMVAHVGAGIVWGFSALGVPIMRIESCKGLAITNMAYGGKDNRTLFITESESGCVLIANLDVPGRPMHSHQ